MMQRFITLDAKLGMKAENGDLTLDTALASEAPVERFYGIEILDMGPQSVRLGRINDGASVLFNHNPNEIRGSHVPGMVRIDADKMLRSPLRFTAGTQPGRDTIALIEGRHLTKASVGYSIHKVVEQTKKDGRTVEREIDGRTFERVVRNTVKEFGENRAAFTRTLDAAVGAFDRAQDEIPIYRVVDWEPFETSLTPVPADASVGIGRSQYGDDSAATAVRDAGSTTTAAPAATPKGLAMSDVNTAAAGAPTAEPKPQDVTALQVEKERREAITNLCKANKITDSRVQERWIQGGLSWTQITAELYDALEERGKADPVAASTLGLSNKETQRYSLFRAIRAQIYGAQQPDFVREAAFEIECTKQVAKKIGREAQRNILIPGEILQRAVGPEAATRAMATQPGSKGGFMVAVENMGFIDILRNRSVAMRMGARVLSGLQGNVMFPRQTGKVTVTWQAGEGVSTAAADQALGQLSMTPKTAIAITDVSEQLLRQATPSAEAFVMADLAADVAIDGVDATVINGTGGSQPLGIKNTTGVTTGQDSAAATYAKVLAFVSTAGTANAIRGNPGWVTNTAGAAVLMQRQRFTSTDTPLWTGNMLDGQCVGFNAMSSEQLASGNLIFGSWDEVVIGEWGVLELSTDNGGTRFNTAQVGIRAMWMVDVLVRYPQAFVVSTNLS